MAPVTHEIFKKFELAGGQIERSAASRHRSPDDVHIQIRDAQLPADFGDASPDQSTNACQQFWKCEWFNEIVVCARIKAAYPILYCVSGGQEQNGHLESLLPERRENFKTTSAREHHIQNQQIEQFRLN
jgi:hypothetical protein